MSTVTVQIPEEVMTLAGLENDSCSVRATKLLALELYREGRVSLGRAAELAGLSIEQFMDMAAQRQVPSHYGNHDLDDDRQTAARLHL